VLVALFFPPPRLPRCKGGPGALIGHGASAPPSFPPSCRKKLKEILKYTDPIEYQSHEAATKKVKEELYKI
jgi:hypothetical protein